MQNIKKKSFRFPTTRKKRNYSPVGISELAILPACQSLHDVRALLIAQDDNFKAKATAAIIKKKAKVGSNKMVVVDRLFHDPSALDVPQSISQQALLTAFDHLSTGLAAIADDGSIEFAFLTIIDGAFQTSSQKTVLDFHGLQSKAKRTLSKMSKDYVGVNEIATFNSDKHPLGGRMMSAHCHALIWGVDVIDKARLIAAQDMEKFGPNFSGAKQIVVRRVLPDPLNLARIIAYMLKAPDQHKTLYRDKDGIAKNTHSSPKADRKIQYLRSAQIRSMLSLEQIIFGSGEGAQMRRILVKLLRAQATAGAGGRRRALHPDEIASFWVGLFTDLGRSYFNLPVIKNRP